MIQKDVGFVIRRHNFRETSLIATIYTSRFGKISGIFKGFYTSKKEFSSHLDIFSLNEFIFYPKKSEIWLVSHADLISDYQYLRNNISKARAAGILFNLIDKTMQVWDENKYVFDLIKNCLDLIEEERELKIFYIFLIKFLTFSGFQPEFSRCIGCNNKLSRNIAFSVSKGGLICEDCFNNARDAKIISKQTSRVLSYIQETDFSLVSRVKPTPECEKQIFYILKEFLAYHFEFNELADPKVFRHIMMSFNKTDKIGYQ